MDCRGARRAHRCREPPGAGNDLHRHAAARARSDERLTPPSSVRHARAIPPQTTHAPIGLPPIDAGVHFDPKSLLRGAREAVGDRGVDGVPGGPWSPTAVDDPPALLTGPPLAYPEVLRRAGTAGTVVVQVVIDTLGQAEPRSLALESSHA